MIEDLAEIRKIKDESRILKYIAMKIQEIFGCCQIFGIVSILSGYNDFGEDFRFYNLSHTMESLVKIRLSCI